MFIVNLYLLTTLITFIPFREVGKNLVVPGGARVIDAQKKLVMPGNNIKENKCDVFFLFFFHFKKVVCTTVAIHVALIST